MKCVIISAAALTALLYDPVGSPCRAVTAQPAGARAAPSPRSPPDRDAPLGALINTAGVMGREVTK